MKIKSVKHEPGGKLVSDQATKQTFFLKDRDLGVYVKLGMKVTKLGTV